MNSDNNLSSVIAPYIEGLLKEKRALGYDYRTEELILFRFDKYCTSMNLDTLNITRDILGGWMEQSENESAFNQGKRISVVRQLLLYMASLGIAVYIPHDFCHFGKKMPHILSDSELAALFKEIDSYSPAGSSSRNKDFVRLSNEYKILFRMIYLCGLRNSEAAGLAMSEVDLDTGILTILNSKRNKDRLVYMSEDMTYLCRHYYTYLCEVLEAEPQWLFPSLDPAKPLVNTSVDRRFKEAWRKTIYSTCCNDDPTVHDLRFTFVTNRINRWFEEGQDINVMLPYLSSYLGHKSIQETHYYYHLTLDASKMAHKMDKTSVLVIPGEVSYE